MAVLVVAKQELIKMRKEQLGISASRTCRNCLASADHVPAVKTAGDDCTFQPKLSCQQEPQMLTGLC